MEATVYKSTKELDLKKVRVDNLEQIVLFKDKEYKIDYEQRNVFNFLYGGGIANPFFKIKNFYITSDNYIYSNYYLNFIKACSLNSKNLKRYKNMVKNFSINKFSIITEQKYLFCEIMQGYDKDYVKDVDSFFFNNILKRYLDNFK